MTLTSKEMYENIKPKKRSFLARLTIFAVAMVLVGIAVFFIFFKEDKKPEYVTVKPVKGSVESTVSASGTISATNEVKIGSQISGTILDVLVEENDRVKKGDVLAVINPETINQNIARNEAQLNSAKAALKSSEVSFGNKKRNYDRYKKLYDATGGKSPSISNLENARMDYETALADIDVKKASVTEAETTLNSAKIDLKNAIIVSPVDGVVLKKSIDAGQTVAAAYSTPELFTVAENLEKMKLVVKISEADVGKVTEGQGVSFTVDAYPEEVFRSVVHRVNVGSTKSTDNIVSYETTVYIENKGLYLRSGMSATADIVTAKADDTLLVPVTALYFNPETSNLPKAEEKSGFFVPPPMRGGMNIKEDKSRDKSGTVWVLKNGNPEKVEVDLGVSDGKNTQIITSKISADTPVITSVKLPNK